MVTPVADAAAKELRKIVTAAKKTQGGKQSVRKQHAQQVGSMFFDPFFS